MSPQSPADASEILEHSESEQNADALPERSCEPAERVQVMLLTADDVQQIAARTAYRVVRGLAGAQLTKTELPMDDLHRVVANVVIETFDAQNRIRSKHLRDRLAAQASQEKARG